MLGFRVGLQERAGRLSLNLAALKSYNHKIAGVDYLVRFAHLKTHRGYCTRPDAKRPEIRIKAGLSADETLEVICHEFLHAAAFDLLSEDWVEQTGAELAALLLKMGYQKNEP